MLQENYILHKKKIGDLQVSELRHNFEVKRTLKPTKYIRIIYHHSENRKNIKDIFDLHYYRYRWACIGYHFVIDKKGKIYQTRDLDIAGSHTHGFNQNSIGVCLIGNFDKEKPTKDQFDSFVKLVKTLNLEFEIKETIGHSQAVYKQLKHYFWKLNLPDFNPFEFEDTGDYYNFIRNTNNKILRFDAGIRTQDKIKLLKTCPGFWFYKALK